MKAEEFQAVVPDAVAEFGRRTAGMASGGRMDRVEDEADGVRVGLVALGAQPADAPAAVAHAGALLVASGAVLPDYVESMLRRDAAGKSRIVPGVAILRGSDADRGLVRRDVLAVLQVPGGVEWGEGGRVSLVVAIAAPPERQVAPVARLTRLLADPALIARLSETEDAAEIASALSAGRRPEETAMPARRDAVGAPAPQSREGPVLSGIAGSPGIAVGRVRRLASRRTAPRDVPAPLADGAASLEAAVSKTRFKLSALADDARRRLGADEGAIFEAQIRLLDDPGLIAATCRSMVDGQGVAFAWHGAVEARAADWRGRGDAERARRAADLLDAGGRVLGLLDPTLLARDPLDGVGAEGAVLVADDLAPSDTASLDPRRALGLVTAAGGADAHTAVVARTLGLPAVVGLGEAQLARIGDGTVIVDGDRGEVRLDPQADDIAQAQAAIAARETAVRETSRARGEPAATEDGHAVEILANVNLPEQAAACIAQGADGVGLMRTEFLFLERGSSPSEAEQEAAYREMLAALGGKRLVVRALDIGGDKQVPHLALPQEGNPSLGVRGSRLLLARPDLLEPQLRALYSAAKAAPTRLSIMFPMVTGRDELRALRAACERARLATGGPRVAVGIMVEVPAAALEAGTLAADCDFFSIGTNDLTQYALATDRQNPALAASCDALNPAVLRLIAMTVAGAATRSRPVGVCGGLAGDPFGAALLSGLGVDALSMTPRDIPGVKARLRSGTIEEFRALARDALAAGSAGEVRGLEEVQ